MATKPDATGTPTAIELLKEELAAAEDQAGQAEEKIAAARAEANAAKANVKRLHSALALLSGKPTNGFTSLSKESVRPYVERLLADGDVADAEFLERLQALLRKDGIATSGIALVLRHLKKDYGVDNVDGVWSLSPSEALAAPSKP